MSNVKASWSGKKINKIICESRKNYEKLYLGERILLKEYFKENFSVLDIGCAQGGFVNILTHLNKKFSYTGVDYNKKMLALAKKENPKYKFLNIQDNNFAKNIDQKFDLVIVFGILHLNKDWKKILKEAKKLCKKYLIFDMRECDKEIKKSIYLDLDKNEKKIPYYIIEKQKIKNFLKKEFKNKKIIKINYEGIASKFSNYKTKINFGNYCIYQ
jgi:SAM-dependent methyltransferase